MTFRQSSSPSLGLTLKVLTLFATFITPIIAQVGTVLDKSQLPDCAFSCPAVTNAQTVCVPPAAPATNQATYQSCFCNSAYLTAFKGNTFVNICNGICSDNDLTVIRTWFTNLCQTGGAVVTPNQNAAVAATTTAGAAATAAAAAPAASSTLPIYNNGANNQTWIQTHYNWLIFVVVIILAGIAGIFFGLWLKKRHNRKVADLRTQESALQMEEAARAIQSRHPSEMTLAPTAAARLSMKSRERLSGYTDADSEIGYAVSGEPMPPSRPMSTTGVPAAVYRSGGVEGQDKKRMDLARVQDMGVGGDSSSSVPRSVRSEASSERRSNLRKTLR